MWKLKKNLLVMYKISFVKFLGILITLGDIFISFPVAIFWRFKSKKVVPPVTDDLLLTPAVSLARKIRDEQLTSEKLVTTFIDRIKEVNPIVNAIVEDRFSIAVEEAKRVDKIIDSGIYSQEQLEERYPLFGIPITVKESIAVTDMSNAAGLISSRGKASRDAEIVEKIKNAGGIIIAVTNTPELCMDWECFNNITGRTSNPYDNRRTTGGSSGGEAALISSAASIIGVGSDTLGSLRLPAHFCGIFSHRPTSHTVSIEGHFPDAEEREMWSKVFTMGPMTRYSVDLPLIMKVISKDEKKDILDLDREIDYSKLKIFYMERWGDTLTHPVITEIVEAIHKAVNHFHRKYNTQIRKWEETTLGKIAESSLASLIAIKGMDDIFNKNSKQSAVLELFKYFLGLSKHTFFAICYLILHRYQPPYNMEAIRKKILSVEQTISETLDNNGILICPTFPMEALYHGQMLSKSYNNVYMSTFNSLGSPVTVCPVGLSRKGLPIGLQVIGKANCDRITIAVAQEMETLFGGWKLP